MVQMPPLENEEGCPHCNEGGCVMCGYVGFYNGRRWEGYADSLYAAKQQAIVFFKPPKSKQHMVTVALAEKDGEPVVHTPVD